MTMLKFFLAAGIITGFLFIGCIFGQLLTEGKSKKSFRILKYVMLFLAVASWTVFILGRILGT